MTPNQRIIARRLRERASNYPERALIILAVIKPKMIDTLALMERKGWIRMVGDSVEITPSGIAAHEADLAAYERYHPWAKKLSGKATRRSPKTFDGY